MDQELGYAIRVAEERGMDIIALWEGKREDYSKMALLSSNFVHLDDGFQLNSNPRKCFEEVGKYMKEEYKHPVEIFLEADEKFIPGRDVSEIIVLLTIMNNSLEILRDAALDFILPRKVDEQKQDQKVTITLTSLMEENSVIKKKTIYSGKGIPQEDYIKYQSKIIPQNHRYFREVYKDGARAFKERFETRKEIECTRYHFPLADLYGSAAYESRWRFNIKDPQCREFQIGIYINVPIFGPIYYQGKLFAFKNPELEPKNRSISINAF